MQIDNECEILTINLGTLNIVDSFRNTGSPSLMQLLLVLLTQNFPLRISVKCNFYDLKILDYARFLFT